MAVLVLAEAPTAGRYQKHDVKAGDASVNEGTLNH